MYICTCVRVNVCMLCIGWLTVVFSPTGFNSHVIQSQQDLGRYLKGLFVSPVQNGRIQITELVLVNYSVLLFYCCSCRTLCAVLAINYHIWCTGLFLSYIFANFEVVVHCVCYMILQKHNTLINYLRVSVTSSCSS